MFWKTLETIMAIIINLQQAFRRNLSVGSDIWPGMVFIMMVFFNTGHLNPVQYLRVMFLLLWGLYEEETQEVFDH